MAEIYTHELHQQIPRKHSYLVHTVQHQGGLCVRGDNQTGLRGRRCYSSTANFMPSDLGLKEIASVSTYDCWRGIFKYLNAFVFINSHRLKPIPQGTNEQRHKKEKPFYYIPLSLSFFVPMCLCNFVPASWSSKISQGRRLFSLSPASTPEHYQLVMIRPCSRHVHIVD